jgi:branched-subunit amino acid aminotransferase/4-amino-4-deoxychorismate lyase
VMRDALLRSGEIQTRVLRREDLARTTRVWWVNAVREWVPVALTPART